MYLNGIPFTLLILLCIGFPSHRPHSASTGTSSTLALLLTSKLHKSVNTASIAHSLQQATSLCKQALNRRIQSLNNLVDAPYNPDTFVTPPEKQAAIDALFARQRREHCSRVAALESQLASQAQDLQGVCRCCTFLWFTPTLVD